MRAVGESGGGIAGSGTTIRREVAFSFIVGKGEGNIARPFKIFVESRISVNGM